MVATTARRAPTPATKAVQREVGQRWTPRLAKVGWTPISDFFLKNYYRLKISHTEAMVIVHLMSFKWDSSAPFPGLKTLARRMGITPTSVRSHIRRLEVRGFLDRQFIVGTTNRFKLEPLFKKLEEMMDQDQAAAEGEEVTPPPPAPPLPPRPRPTFAKKPSPPPLPPPPAFIERLDEADGVGVT